MTNGFVIKLQIVENECGLYSTLAFSQTVSLSNEWLSWLKRLDRTVSCDVRSVWSWWAIQLRWTDEYLHAFRWVRQATVLHSIVLLRKKRWADQLFCKGETTSDGETHPKHFEAAAAPSCEWVGYFRKILKNCQNRGVGYEHDYSFA